MKTSSVGLELIQRAEGWVDHPYIDAGGWSIGYGSRLSKAQLAHYTGKTISRDEGTELMRGKLNTIEMELNDRIKVPVTQNQFDALVSFTYNLGTTNFNNSTLLKELNKSNYEAAADELRKWVKSGGKTLGGLVARREEERTLFLTSSQLS